MRAKQSLILLPVTALFLTFLVLFGIRQYDFNVSGLLHMDVPFGETHDVPEGLVLYQDGAYDGMLYYQVARDLPALFFGGTPSLDSPYRFQRILLPLVTYIVTVGNERAFPVALLLINLLCALASLCIIVLITKKLSVHALTIVFNPAVLIGILYSLTEPLSLLLMVLFFFWWEKNGRKMNIVTIIMLILSLLARETTVFLIGLLFLWYLFHKQWKQALLVMISIPLLILWQYFLILRLGDVGFQANSNIIDFPFQGPMQIFIWLFEGKKVSYVLSSIGLLCFVFPLFLHLCREWYQKRTRIDVFTFLIGGLTLTMLTMDAHMWGAITSIGRVVTPLYPVYALYATSHDTTIVRTLSLILMMVSIIAAIGIATVRHPFVLS